MIRLLLHRITGRVVVLVTFEAFLIASAVVLSAIVRLRGGTWRLFLDDNGPVKVLVVAAVCQVCLYYADAYNLREMSDRRTLFVRIIQALASASFILAVTYYWFPSLILGRGVFILASVVLVTFVVGWRVAFEWIGSRVAPSERLLLVGTSEGALTLARELFERRHELGVEIVGFVDPDPARVGAPVINPGVVGTIEDIPSIVRARAVDRVVVSLADSR